MMHVWPLSLNNNKTPFVIKYLSSTRYFEDLKVPIPVEKPFIFYEEKIQHSVSSVCWWGT